MIPDFFPALKGFTLKSSASSPLKERMGFRDFWGLEISGEGSLRDLKGWGDDQPPLLHVLGFWKFLRCRSSAP